MIHPLYFLNYKMGAFPFHKNPENLDPSYMMDLDFGGGGGGGGGGFQFYDLSTVFQFYDLSTVLSGR